jgi:hypothetical protein
MWAAHVMPLSHSFATSRPLAKTTYDQTNITFRPASLPQSTAVRAPVVRVTRFGPQATLVPLLLGLATFSPPGQ